MAKTLMIVPRSKHHVAKLTAAQAKDLLAYLIGRLDEADLDDALGTEGWRRYFDLED